MTSGRVVGEPMRPRRRRIRRAPLMVGCFVLSIAMVPVSLGVAERTELTEVTPFFSWRLYAYPRDPAATSVPRIVRVAANNRTPVGLRGYEEYNAEALHLQMTVLANDARAGDDGVDHQLACLVEHLGLEAGTYELHQILASEIDEPVTSDALATAIVPSGRSC